MPPFVIATVPRLALREPPPGEVKPGVQWAVLIPQGHEVAVNVDDRERRRRRRGFSFDFDTDEQRQR